MPGYTQTDTTQRCTLKGAHGLTDGVFSSLPQTAGLHPTAEQIEMFAYHLPDATLSNLVVSIAAHALISKMSSFVNIR